MKTIATTLLLLIAGVIFAQNQFPAFPDFKSLREFENCTEPSHTDFEKFRHIDDFEMPIHEDLLKSVSVKNKTQKQQVSANQNNSASISSSQNSFALVKSLNQQNSTYYKEKLDSIVYYDDVTGPEYDSVKVKEVVHSFNQDSNRMERITLIYDTITDDLINYEKFIYTNDPFYTENYQRIEIKYYWLNDEWVPDDKVVGKYNQDKLPTQYANYKWDKQISEWYPVTKSEAEYDIDKKLISYTNYSIGDDNNWKIQRRYEFTYFESGEDSTQVDFANWDETFQKWMYESYREYNKQGQIVISSYKSYRLQSDTLALDEEKQEYEYLDDDFATLYISRQNSNREYNDTIKYKYEREYENDKLVKEIKLQFIDEVWKCREKQIYEYDEFGNKILSEHYMFYYNKWQIIYQVISHYSETGKLTKNESYNWIRISNTQNYIKKGANYYEVLYDTNGNSSIVTYYKWNNEIENWKIDYKIFQPYSTNKFQQTLETFQFFNKSYTASYERGNTMKLTYNDSIGKYTEIDDGLHNKIQITYNEIGKVDELTYSTDGIIFQKTECFYDQSGRDSLWMNHDYLSLKDDTLINYVRFTYQKLNASEITITELHYDNQPDTLFDIYGSIQNIRNGNIEEAIENILSNGRITESTYFNVSWNQVTWTSTKKMKYTYNESGQIKTTTNLEVNNELKSEYIFRNDTLTINKYLNQNQYGDPNWKLSNKKVYQVDSSIDKSKFQPIPTLLINPNESIADAYEWHLQYDFGKVLELVEYFGYDEYRNYNFTAKSKFYYSPASALQGDAIVSGYIFDETGTTKSVSTTMGATGNPLAGVSVSLCDSNDDYVLATVTSDANGFYEFKGVPEGNFYLKVELEDYNQTSTYNIEVTNETNTFENKNFVVSNGEIITNVEELPLTIKVYPNPTSGKIRIEGLNPNSLNRIKIIGSLGNVIYNIETEDVSKTIDIPGMVSGIYLLEITSEKTRKNYKIVKQ